MSAVGRISLVPEFDVRKKQYTRNLVVDFEWFFDSNVAFSIIEQRRWRHGKKCPRCRSVYVRDVNTSVFRELCRCIDCTYMFNTLSHTLFQGTKIPLNKFFQLFVVAQVSPLKPREVSYLLDISIKTSQSLASRLADLPDGITFAASDPVMFNILAGEHDSYLLAANALMSAASAQQADNIRHFLAYCDTLKIVIDPDRFLQYLDAVLSIERNG